MDKIYYIAGFTVLAFLTIIGDAAAQETAIAITEAAEEAGGVISLKGAAITSVGVLSTILSVVLFKIWKWLSKKIGIEGLLEDGEVKKQIDALLEEAAEYGVANLEDADWLNIETRNTAVATGVNFALEQAPKLLEKAGITKRQLKQRLEAKLLKYDEQPGVWEVTEASLLKDSSKKTKKVKAND